MRSDHHCSWGIDPVQAGSPTGRAAAVVSSQQTLLLRLQLDEAIRVRTRKPRPALAGADERHAIL